MLFTETVPTTTLHTTSDAITNPTRIAVPPGYPIPSDLSAKSAIVVPASVVPTTTPQYRYG